MAAMTYGRLDKVLRSLGFTVTILQDGGRTARAYQHPESGAGITLPKFPDEQEVQAGHLVVVRAILDGFGIPEPLELASRVPRAS
jgi:hypothetical protein